MGNTNESQQKTIISLRGVNLRPLSEDYPWLEEIDLDINENELVAIGGPQNSGKSGLLKVIGLLERPDSGVVKINDIDTWELDPHRLVEMKVSIFGYLWQQPQLDLQMSGIENVYIPLVSAGIKRDSCIEKSVEALRFVGLSDEKRKLPARMLSLLDQQKVALARELAREPEVIIAQEPTGSMRVAGLREFDEILERVVRERNMSVVCSSHDLKMMKAADRIVWMDNGKIAKIGTFDEGSPKHVGRNASIFRYPNILSEGLYYSGKYKGDKEALLRNATEKYQHAVKRLTILRGERESTDADLIKLQINELQEAVGMLNDTISSLQKVLET